MYEFKNPCVIDFSKYKTIADMYEDFKQVFGFPDYYGNNLDAFWDCMTDIIGKTLYIEINGLTEFEKQHLKDATIFEKILNRLKDYAGKQYARFLTI